MIDVGDWALPLVPLFWLTLVGSIWATLRWRKTGICPHCKGKVPLQATACRHCTRDLIPPG